MSTKSPTREQLQGWFDEIVEKSNDTSLSTAIAENNKSAMERLLGDKLQTEVHNFWQKKIRSASGSSPLRRFNPDTQIHFTHFDEFREAQLRKGISITGKTDNGLEIGKYKARLGTMRGKDVVFITEKGRKGFVRSIWYNDLTESNHTKKLRGMKK